MNGKPKDIPAARKAMEALLEQDFQDWQSSINPMQTRLILAYALKHVPWEVSRPWDKIQMNAFARNQLRKGPHGWWSERSLGITSGEMPEFQGKSRDIWVTSLMLMSGPHTGGTPCPYCLKNMWEEAEEK